MMERRQAESRLQVLSITEHAGYGIAGSHYPFATNMRLPPGLCQAGAGRGHSQSGLRGNLTMPPLPHHQAYGSVPRQFGG